MGKDKIIEIVSKILNGKREQLFSDQVKEDLFKTVALELRKFL